MEATAANQYTPIGSIIASILDPLTFAAQVGDSQTFDPKKDRWLPADGRYAAGSTFAKVTGRTIVPNLLGMFLRGINQFQTGGPEAPKEWSDPDGTRQAGSPQQDMFEKHVHCSYRVPVPGDGGGAAWVTNSAYDSNKRTEEFWAQGGEETRPKNVAVFYYIRIND